MTATTTPPEVRTTPDSPTTPAVRVCGLGKRYGRVTVLHDIDLEVGAGKFLVLLGPSGSGKSTLLRALAGIEKPDAGEIAIDGRTVSGAGRHVAPEHRDLAMVFQDYALWPHMTVQQNVAFALRRRKLSSADTAGRVAGILERVGLGDKAERYPNELSGGQQQRVALARALVAEPKLILFDEPLSNLDADLRERLRIEIATLTAEVGATAVYITHDQAEAFALADEIVVLDGGRIIQRGAPETVYQQPATPFVARFTGLGGRFTGTACDHTPGRLRVTDGEHAVVATATADAAPGSQVEVLVRPTALGMHPAGASRLEDHATFLEATVVDVAYRGAAYDHVLDTPLGRLSSVRDTQSWTRGSTCLVRIAAESAFAFPMDVTSEANSR